MTTSILQKSLGSNMWRKEGRIVIPKRRLVFYAPLWHPQLSGSTFNAWDLVTPGVHSCTVTSAIYGSQGRIFGGDGKISFPSTINYATDTTYSLETWVKVTTTARQVFAAWGSSTSSTPFILFYVDSDKYITMKHRNDESVLATLKDTSLVVADTWYHVVGVRRAANSWELYINGVSVDTDATNVTGAVTLNTFWIGQYQSTTVNWPLSGTIGEMLFYSDALTTAEVVHRHQLPKWRYQ